MNVFEAVRENGITTRQAAEHCGIKIKKELSNQEYFTNEQYIWSIGLPLG